MKLDKRKLLGPLFGPLSRAKHSRTSRILVATAWMPSQLLRARHNRPYFAVDLYTSKGMGAVLTEVVLLCHYAETNGLIPRVISTNSLYSSRRGEDCISHYLGPQIQGHVPDLRPMRFHTFWSLSHLKFAEHVPLEVANRLFWTYLPPKPIVTDEVDPVLAGVPGRKFDLSIHYRGTDKAREAPLVGFNAYDEAILAHQVSGGRLESVFLATDDLHFEMYIRGRYPATNFITYNRGSPSDASRGRHFSDLSPADKSIESLVNMFLLAAAPTCIRGMSYMSATSKILNPALRTVSLNRTHWGSGLFPEFEILAEEDADCVEAANTSTVKRSDSS